MDVSTMAASIAADMAPASAPLQGSSEVSSQPLVQETASTEVVAPVTPSKEVPVQETSYDDEFTIDLDKEPVEGEADAPPPPEAAQEQEEGVDADSEVGKLLATSRGRRIYAEFKKAQALAELPDAEDPTKGGIGHVPSVEQVKEYYGSHVDNQAMAFDFNSGDPAKAETFIKHWFGKDEGGQSRPGSAEMMQRMAEVLPRVNHDAYAAFAAPAINTFIDGLYREAANEADPAIRESMVKGAQVAEWWITGGSRGGTFRDPAQSAQQPQQQPGQVHPDILRAQQILAQASQQTQLQNQQRLAAFDKNVTTAANRAIVYDVDQALAPLKTAISPFLYESLRDKFVAEIDKGLAQNRDGMRQFDIRKSQAQRTASETDVQQLARMKRQMAASIIIAKRSEFIKAAGANLVEQSTKRHAQLQHTSSRTSPNASQIPVKRDISAALERAPGETHSDWMLRQVKSDFGVPAR